MLKAFRNFYKLYPIQTIVVTVLFFLESISEGIGISLIIPVFEKLLVKSGENRFTELIDRIYHFIGIEPNVINILCGLVLAFVLKGGVMFVSRYVISKTSAQFLYDRQNAMFEQLMKLKLDYFHNVKQGNLINTLTLEAQRAAVTFIFSAQWVSYLLAFFLYVFFAMFISGWLTIVAALIGVATLSPLKIVTKLSEKYGHRTTELNEEIQSDLIETFNSIKILKAQAFEKQSQNRFHQQVSNYRDNWFKVYLNSNSIHIYSQPITVFVLSLILFFAHKFSIPFAELLVFLVAFQRMLPTFTNMQSVKNNLNLTIPGFQRIENLFKQSEGMEERIGGEAFTDIKHAIKFKNVHFSYVQSRPIFQGISLEIPVNQTIALLGGSGVGKTTLVDLLLGFYAVEGGEILIDDKNLNQLDLKSWRSQIAYVSQDVVLFHDTIKNNICWGDHSISQEEIEVAAKKAWAHEFINELENGYDTIIGDRGVKLSGGQRQRIALARALVKRPKLLILDEATSALDHESELAVKKSIAELKQNKNMTIIMVAHRFTTVREADLIYVLKEGKVVERGSWSELSKNKESYINYGIEENS